MIDIEWKTQYEVGNLEIDAEHKVFVRIIQRIQQAMKRRMPMSYLERLVVELFKYADFHFCSEENVMFSVGYPELEKHQQEHKKLLIELKTLIPAYGAEERDFHELVDFLMRWFNTHTVTEDQKVAMYINRAEHVVQDV